MAILDTAAQVDFADVPVAGPEATVDHHWLELRGSSALPTAYLPPAMPSANRRPGWLRAVAVGLIAMFVLATVAGVCLTYGPSAPWH